MSLQSTFAQGSLKFEGLLFGSTATPPNDSSDYGQVRVFLVGDHLSGIIGHGRSTFPAVAAQLVIEPGTIISQFTRWTDWGVDIDSGDYCTKGAPVDLVLTADQKMAMLNGQVYARITTAAYPEGELRGQDGSRTRHTDSSGDWNIGIDFGVQVEPFNAPA